MSQTPDAKLREKLQDLLTRRFFFVNSFEIYGGTKGLFDWGPPACAIKANFINFWRRHFVMEDNMLEIECTNLTPDVVLRTSGHVEKFADLMVKDSKTNAAYRVDHLLKEWFNAQLEKKETTAEQRTEYENHLARLDDYKEKDFAQLFAKYQLKAPETGNDLTEILPFNLMFGTLIGPTGDTPGFLRPETAQGMFVNFRRLLDFNGGKLPFAAAQVGLAFRNEIAPRAGLLRVREFTMAEIEHFVNPKNKAHPKFASVAHLVLPLFSRELQEENKAPVQMTLGEAVSKGIINNETLGYFVGRTFQFLTTIGVHNDKLRFRQHMANEMAHYACDCWDAEIKSSYGWVECVGIADRACYDLSVHQDKSKVGLTAYEDFPDGPRMVTLLEVKPNTKAIATKHKKATGAINTFLSNASQTQLKALKEELTAKSTATINVEGGAHELTPDMVSINEVTKRVTGETFLPSVIEPSFGVGRIIYSLLEHSYNCRPENAQKGYLSLSPVIAPFKVSVLPLVSNEEILAYIPKISAILNQRGLTHKVDSTGQKIGKRYARTDEIGIPFGITIDYDTLKDNTVTLRERDSTTQVRIAVDDLTALLDQLCTAQLTWNNVWNNPKYPHVESKEEKD